MLSSRELEVGVVALFAVEEREKGFSAARAATIERCKAWGIEWQVIDSLIIRKGGILSRKEKTNRFEVDLMLRSLGISKGERKKIRDMVFDKNTRAVSEATVEKERENMEKRLKIKKNDEFKKTVNSFIKKEIGRLLGGKTIH